MKMDLTLSSLEDSLLFMLKLILMNLLALGVLDLHQCIVSVQVIKHGVHYRLVLDYNLH